MKKILPIIIALILAMALAACGGRNSGGEINEPKTVPSEEDTAAEAEEETSDFVETLDMEMDPSMRGNTSSALSNMWGSSGLPAKVGDKYLLTYNYFGPDGVLIDYGRDADIAVYSVNATDDAIYFLNPEKDKNLDNIIFKMDLDCTNVEEVFRAEYCLITLVRSGDWLYYCMFNAPEYDAYICRVKTDGTGNEIVIDPSLEENGSPSPLGSKFCVGQNAIYYGGFNGSLFKADLDGSNPRKLGNNIEINPADVKIHGEWIYYEKFNEGGSGSSLCRVKTDGTEDSVVIQEIQYDYDFFGDKIYFNSADKDGVGQGLYAINDDGSGEPTLIFDEHGGSSMIIAFDETIYFDAGSAGGFILTPEGKVLHKQTYFASNFDPVG